LAGHRRNAPVTALARDRRIPLNFSNPAHRLFTRALFYRAFIQDLNPLLTPGRSSLGVFGGSFPGFPMFADWCAAQRSGGEVPTFSLSVTPA
jgi:hypothetical protein